MLCSMPAAPSCGALELEKARGREGGQEEKGRDTSGEQEIAPRCRHQSLTKKRCAPLLSQAEALRNVGQVR